ncbi:hypothetical protein KKH82_08240 [Patescibacteria group bacterium]|nr:hypothetical protein [Patescibacteria group bacterium]
MIPYNSWLRKLPILPNIIHKGTITTRQSKSRKKSFQLNCLLFLRMRKEINTHTIPPTNDIHHFRTAMISHGCAR